MGWVQDPKSGEWYPAGKLPAAPASLQIAIEVVPQEKKEALQAKAEDNVMDNKVELTQEWAKVGGRAYMKFQELDTDGDGELDQQEVGGLVKWILGTFRPQGRALNPEELVAEEQRLISELDKAITPTVNMPIRYKSIS